MQQAQWVIAAASAIGNGHLSENIPCQDASKVEYFENFCITVVCDGAGSCKNSDKGSKQVANSCVYHFKSLVTQQGWNNGQSLPEDKIWHKLAKQTLYTVREDLENFSINHNLEYKSLSCTVIITIAFHHGLLVTHIGDGRAGFCDSKAEWRPTITPFRGQLANQTVFITSDIWDEEIIDNYVESTVIRDEVKAFCLLSDGCEKASFECNLYNEETNTYFDPNRPFPLFFNPNTKVLEQLYKEGKSEEEINGLWEKFLSSGNQKLKLEPDDKTMILGVRLTNNN